MTIDALRLSGPLADALLAELNGLPADTVCAALAIALGCAARNGGVDLDAALMIVHEAHSASAEGAPC